MNKDITTIGIFIIIIAILLFKATASDSELLEQCGSSESCKYSVVAH